MTTSIPESLHREWVPSPSDLELKGKTIAVIFVAMRHRDYVYKVAHELGTKLVFLDCEMDPWAKPYAHDFIQVPCGDSTNKTVLISLLDQYIAQQRVATNNPEWTLDGICSFDEYSIVVASEVAHHYNKPCIPPSTVAKVKHKHNLRLESEKAGIYVPKSKLLPITPFLNHELEAELSKWQFPIVLKPVAGASSNFVRKIESYTELYKCVNEYYIESLRTNVQSHWYVGKTEGDGQDSHVEAPFMVEEFMYGPEVDIDMVVQNGQIKFMGVADNFPSKGSPDLFMEAGGCQPSQLESYKQTELLEMSRRLVSHFGTDLNGVFHFEAKYTPNGPSPIEMNLRLGGCEVLSLCLAVYGVNLGIQQLKVACGIPIPDNELNTTPKRICASTNILAVDSGYVQDVGFTDERTINNPNFMGGMHRCHVNMPLKAPPLGFHFCAWMVARGETIEEAMENIAYVTKGFFITFRPYDESDPNGRVGGNMQGKYYLEGSERAKWKLIKQVGHDLESWE